MTFTMKLMKLENKHKLILKYILISILAFCAVFSDIFIKQKNFNNQLSVNSIFIFLIIGLSCNNIGLLIITLLNCILFKINGFNILTSIEALEIYYVLFLYRKHKKNITVEVLLFWVLLAFPLLLITNCIVNHSFSLENTFFILLIFLNRIFNVLFSEIFINYIPFERIPGITYAKTETKTISNLLIFSCIALTVIPLNLFTWTTYSNSKNEISELAVKDLKYASDYANQKVNLFTDDEKNNLKLKNPIQLYALITILKTYISSSDNSVNFYLIDFDNTIVSSTNSENYTKNGLAWLKKGTLTKIDSNIYKWTAPVENVFIPKNYSRKYDYVYVTKLNSQKIIITVSQLAYNSKYIYIYLNLLLLFVLLSLFVISFVLILKHTILSSISKLISITSDLPEKLKNNETIVFEKTNLSEINSLKNNFQSMVTILSNMILNVKATNKRLEESEQLLFKQAHFDSLTGLPNRHYFIEYAEKIIKNFYTDKIYAHKHGIAFLFLDLDKFKAVNDIFGHSSGDKLLVEVASRMNTILKTYDSPYTFIGRLGGDEFIIAFIYNTKDEIIKLADNLIASIKQPVMINDNKATVEASIGICLYPEDAKDLNNILIKSDTSMYKAKSSGNGKFLFYSSLS